MDDSSSSKSKKRDIERPRITYHTPDRTFDRLFKEKSLDATKDVVRKKLGLDAKVSIELVQLRASTKIDLEDDDDFDAFRALAHTTSHVDVMVNIEGREPVNLPSAGPTPSTIATEIDTPAPRQKMDKKRERPSSPEPSPIASSSKPVSSSSRTKNALVQNPTASNDIESAEPRKKKRKVAFDEAPPPEDTPAATNDTDAELTTSKEKKKKRKNRNKDLSSTSHATSAESTSPRAVSPPRIAKPTETSEPPQLSTPHDPSSSQSSKKAKRKKSKMEQSSNANSTSSFPSVSANAIAHPSTPSTSQPSEPETSKKRKRAESPAPSTPKPSNAEFPTSTPVAEVTGRSPRKKRRNRKLKEALDSPITDATATPTDTAKPAKPNGRSTTAVDSPVEAALNLASASQKPQGIPIRIPGSVAPPSHAPPKDVAAIVATPSPAPETGDTLTKEKKKRKRIPEHERLKKERRDAKKTASAVVEAPDTPSVQPSEQVEPPSEPVEDSLSKKVKDPQDKSGTADDGSVVSVIPAVQLASTQPATPTSVPSNEPSPAVRAANDATPSTSKPKPRRSSSSKTRPMTRVDDAAFEAAMNRVIMASTQAKSPSESQPCSAIPPQPATPTIASAAKKMASSLSPSPAKTSIPKDKRRKSRLSVSWVPDDSEASPEPPKSTDAATSISTAPVAQETAAIQQPAPIVLAPSTPDKSTNPPVAHSAEPSISPTPAVPVVTASPITFQTIAPSMPVNTNATPNSKPSTSKRTKANDPLCPVCLTRPIHVRSKCPIVTAGADSIDFKIIELESDLADPDLVNELKEFRAKARVEEEKAKVQVAAKQGGDKGVDQACANEGVNAGVPAVLKLLDVNETGSVISGGGSVSGDDTPRSRVPTPLLPVGAKLDGVAVETQDEGSSNEDSDEESDDAQGSGEAELDVEREDETDESSDEDGVKEKEPEINVDELDPSQLEEQLAAVVRGPQPSRPRRSILDGLDKLFEKEATNGGSDSEDEEEEVVLEEEDEKVNRARRRHLPQGGRHARSSSSEPEAANNEEDEEDGTPPTFMDGHERQPSHGPSVILHSRQLTEEAGTVQSEGPGYFEASDDNVIPDKTPSLDTPIPESSSLLIHTFLEPETTPASHSTPEPDHDAPPSVPSLPETEVPEPRNTSPEALQADSPPTPVLGEALPMVEPEYQEAGPHATGIGPQPEVTAKEAEQAKGQDNIDSPIGIASPTSEATAINPEDGKSTSPPIYEEERLDPVEDQEYDELEETPTSPISEHSPLRPIIQIPKQAWDEEQESIDPEDEIDAKENGSEEEDPIEEEEGLSLWSVRTPPSTSTPRAGVAMRMKDRRGLRLEGSLPVLASQASQSFERVEPSSQGPTRRSGRLAQRPASSQGRTTATTSATPEVDAKTERNTTAVATRATSKRRGRLTEEEKAHRAAEKERIRQEKLAAKEVEKMEKERVKQEREVEKVKYVEKGRVGAKGPKQSDSSAIPSASVKSAATEHSSLNDVEDASRSSTVPCTSSHAQDKEQDGDPLQASSAQWAAIPQSSPPQPSESSLVDQLRPSSPEDTPAPEVPASPSKDLPPPSSPEAPLASQVAARDESQQTPITRHPLFLPGSSQFPNASQYASQQKEVSESSASDGEGDQVSSKNPRPSLRARVPPAPAFRRLSQLANSQVSLLSPTPPTPVVHSVVSTRSRVPPKLRKLPSDTEDESSSEASDSDDSSKNKSYIPKSRRAGAPKTRSQKGGLFQSFR